MESTFELHEALKKALGVEQAKTLVRYIDNRVNNESATKVDLKELEIKMYKNIWAAVGVIVGVMTILNFI